MPNHFNYGLMTRFADRNSILCLAVFLLTAWTGIACADIRPFSARYSIYRNGTLTGKAEISLNRQGETWIIQSEGSGTHGLARTLGAWDSEKVVGRVREGQFLPDQYTRHSRLAGMDEYWMALFNWNTNSVQITENDTDLTLHFSGQVLDPLSLKLEMRQRLAKSDFDLTFLMVSEDEIKQQVFRVMRPEMLETSLGCLDTLPVEKVRRSSKRYTRAWHAPGLDHFAVRLEHGKAGGDHVEMRISELKMDGITIVPRQGCASLQTAASP